MTLVCVPVGKFTMGSNDGDADEKPVHEVYLDAYWMDQTEVSNGQFAQCMAAGSCTAPASPASATRSDYYGNAQYANYPVIDVNWREAAVYCTWAGRSLPTEAQWEKAAREMDGRIYPWGNAAPGSDQLNYNGIIGDTTEVGGYPSGASPYSALDMAWNVWEWTADWYGSYSSGKQFNPIGPVLGDHRMSRGGNWLNDEYIVRTSFRSRWYPESILISSGFRCSRSLP